MAIKTTNGINTIEVDSLGHFLGNAPERTVRLLSEAMGISQWLIETLVAIDQMVLPALGMESHLNSFNEGKIQNIDLLFEKLCHRFWLKKPPIEKIEKAWLAMCDFTEQNKSDVKALGKYLLKEPKSTILLVSTTNKPQFEHIYGQFQEALRAEFSDDEVAQIMDQIDFICSFEYHTIDRNQLLEIGIKNLCEEVRTEDLRDIVICHNRMNLSEKTAKAIGAQVSKGKSLSYYVNNALKNLDMGKPSVGLANTTVRQPDTKYQKKLTPPAQHTPPARHR